VWNFWGLLLRLIGVENSRGKERIRLSVKEKVKRVLQGVDVRGRESEEGKRKKKTSDKTPTVHLLQGFFLLLC